MDELFLKMNSTFRYIWVSIDSETRFAFWFLSETRSMNDALKLMKMSPFPEKIVTDGSFSYMTPIKKYYGYRFFYNKYHQCSSFEEKKNNNIVERLNNTLRRYLHPRRGFHSVKTGNIVLLFYWIYYNFIRIHTSIGITPAEKAGVICYDYDVKTELDKLRNLIERSFFVFFYLICCFFKIRRYVLCVGVIG